MLVPGSFARTDEQELYAQLGIWAIGPHAVSFKSQMASSFILKPLVERLNKQFPAVNAAIGVLGVFYAKQAGLGIDEHTVQKQYSRAIVLQRAALTASSVQSFPTGIAALVLSYAELLARRRNNSYFHSRAAQNLLGLASSETWPNERSSDLTHRTVNHSPESACSVSLLEDGLHEFMYAVDTQAALHTDGSRKPGLPPLSWSLPDPLDTDHSSRQRTLTATMHAACHFAAHASNHTTNGEQSRHAIMRQQGRFLGALRLWTSLMDKQSQLRIKPSTDTISVDAGRMLINRSMCICLIIVLSVMSGEDESKWDAYSSNFQEIVVSAESVLGAMNARKQEFRKAFHVASGVISPLLLVATKYRDSLWRHKAITLLQLCSREGFWSATMSAAVAARAAQIEEFGKFDVAEKTSASSVLARQRPSPTGVVEDGSLLAMIPVGNRINTIRILDDESASHNEVCPAEDEGLITLSFLQERHRSEDGRPCIWWERRERLWMQPLTPPLLVETLYLGECLRPEGMGLM